MKKIPDNQIAFYQSPDGSVNIEVLFSEDNIWLTQKKMAELFDTTKQNVSLHLSNIFSEGELSENSVVKDFLTTALDGKKYQTKIYSLEAIIAVGYRVNSERGTQFRIWATRKLKEYIIKGFVMDDDRLANGGVARGYFQEWEERIRKILTSEANFYQKVRDVFATSVDYNPKADYAQEFFATVQNIIRKP